MLFGGPLYTNVVYLLTNRSEALPDRVIALARDNCLAVDAEAIERALEADGHGKRLFAGRVLLQSGGLEYEVAPGLWCVTSHDPDSFSSAAAESLWEKLARGIRIF